MQGAVASGEGRALLACRVGQRDDVVQRLVEQLGDRFRASATPVDIQLRENAHGQRMDALGPRPSGEGSEVLTAEEAEQRLAHLAACRVAVADEQHGNGPAIRGGAPSGGGIDGGLQVDQLDLEPLQLLALLRNSASLVIQRGGELRVERAAIQAAGGQQSRVRRAEAEPAQGEDQLQPGKVGLRVVPVAVRLARRWRQDAGRLVPADPRGGDAGAPGKRRDVHRLAAARPTEASKRS